MTCVLFAVCLALAGCGAETDSDRMIIRIGNGTEPEGLDPHIVTGVPEHHILLTLFEGLVRADTGNLSPTPGVAETWEESEDKLVYTFRLREDAKWSNGEPLTSKDFLYAWERILTPALASEYAYMLFPMKNAQAFNEGAIDYFLWVGGVAPNERTVRITLENPTPYFLSLQLHYSWYPVHQATIEKFGAKEDRISRWTRAGNLVGNGPYVLSRWSPNEIIEMTPNEHYWDAASLRNDGIHFYPITDGQTEERMFRNGELHITSNVPVSKVPVYQAENPEQLRIDPWIGTYFFRFNTTRPPLDDPRVRRALAMALDRDTLCDQVLHAGEMPAPFLTPPGINEYVPTARVTYDVAAARKLLAEAGYPDGEGFRTVDILYATREKNKTIAEAIQQMWKKGLGIDITLSNQDWKVYLSTTSNKVMDYDIASGGWIGDVVDPINFLECFITDNGNNRTGWGNAAYDEYLAKSMAVGDTAQRNNLFDQAETILIESMPIIPIYHYTNPFLIDHRIRGFTSNLLGYYAYHKVYLGDGGSGDS
jgi:oligopeptide transport system substrate-binding protein